MKANERQKNIMHTTQPPSQPPLLVLLNDAIRDRHIKATGALEALTQHAEQVLALCEEYPDNEPLHQLLEHVLAQIVACREEKQATAVQITPLDTNVSSGI